MLTMMNIRDSISYVKDAYKTPEFWTLVILPFSSILAGLFWLSCRYWLRHKAKERIMRRLNGVNENGKSTGVTSSAQGQEDEIADDVGHEGR